MKFCLSNPNELANLLREALGDSRLRAELREKGLERAQAFSWQVTAELVWKNLNEL
jgi:glycosyltransferase involved in cell wall biosynthesis